MKYKFIYSLSFFALYGPTCGSILAIWNDSVLSAFLFLLSCTLFYQLSKDTIYYAKEWLRSALISLSLLFITLLFLEPFLAFGVGLSYLTAAFIQVYLDEMCRSKEELLELPSQNPISTAMTSTIQDDSHKQ